MKCPECGAAELVRDTRPKTYCYRGKEIPIPAVTGDHCPACGVAVLGREEVNRLAKLVGDTLRQENGLERYGVHDRPEFDMANYLRDEEMIRIYLEEMAKDNDPELWASALADVARARERWDLPTPDDGSPCQA